MLETPSELERPGRGTCKVWGCIGQRQLCQAGGEEQAVLRAGRGRLGRKRHRMRWRGFWHLQLLQTKFLARACVSVCVCREGVISFLLLCSLCQKSAFNHSTVFLLSAYNGFNSVLGARDTAVNKTDQTPGFMELVFW